ncbi:helix-turn-helix transcriptional regulator [uncultured Polaribacter sp.]|uniref:helix-turn-helix domain-containing protein n=1 Tax=uncultured Polaribacter sp. TaxID=174711 RepID=UPI0026093AC7|nr:helix-turn-helix transcriptional regulator [uncultured Polaribacter sp.]
MKQPELGLKILSLRKQKGFTQEELVQQCNINVRTIQRIEAGDVSPRSYTIKTILEVLGFDYEEIFQKKYTPGKFDTILCINKNNIYKQLTIAMVFGIIYFLSGFFEIGVDLLSLEKSSSTFKSIYIAIKTISFCALFLFFRGFAIVGGIYNNYLMQITSFLIIVFTLFFSVLDITSLYVWEDFLGIFGMSKLIAFGVLSIIIGIAIKRLVDYGDLAKWTGIIEIITGVCLLMIISSPIAVVSQFIVEIFEVILLYKIATQIKNTTS